MTPKEKPLDSNGSWPRDVARSSRNSTGQQGVYFDWMNLPHNKLILAEDLLKAGG